MDIFKPTQNLIDKVSYVIVAEALVLEQLVKIGLHERLYNVDILHVIVGRWAKNVKDINDLMATDQTHDKYHQYGLEHTFS